MGSIKTQSLLTDCDTVLVPFHGENTTTLLVKERAI